MGSFTNTHSLKSFDLDQMVVLSQQLPFKLRTFDICRNNKSFVNYCNPGVLPLSTLGTRERLTLVLNNKTVIDPGSPRMLEILVD